MDTIETPDEFNLLQVFPDELEQNEHIFYHGTNSVYADHIEKFGLFPNHKPITEFFSVLIQIADDLYAFTYKDQAFSDFNETYRSVNRYFRDFTRVSFTRVSICSANYSIGDTAGGQGIRNLIKLKQAIFDIDYSKLPHMSCEISDSQKHYLSTIDSEIGRVKGSDGVVYAFELSESDIHSLDYAYHAYHGVLLTNKHIEPSKIKAKLVVPNYAIISDDLVKKGNSKTLVLLRSTPPSFIGRIIQNNRKRNPIENVVNDLNK